MYKFPSMSDEELNAVDLVEDGIYDFEVIRSKPKMSHAGNPMAELNIKFWDKNGKIHTLFDNLVFSTVPLNIRKIKHFCDATGLQDYYSRGELPEELGGYSGKFKITTQLGQLIPMDRLNGKAHGSKYPDKNVVEDYILLENDISKTERTSEKNSFDDDLPF